MAGVPPYKQKILMLKDYMIKRLQSSGIDLQTNHEFTLEDIALLKPDIVVVATGSQPYWPQIPGYRPDFCTGVTEVLAEAEPIRKKQVVIIGGGINGCETADYLQTWGNRVTIIEQAQYLAARMEKKNRRALMNRLEDGGAIKKTGSKVIEIADAGVIIQGSDNLIETLEADKVIMATGFVPVNHLYEQLQDKAERVFLIGDALKVRGIKDAVLEGENIGYAVFKARNNW
ncbi:MAG TPA: hypothetical protein DD811_11775 [Syntrophomonas sp.]|nr:hypothetical protein [Syntrophomonas sp.]